MIRLVVLMYVRCPLSFRNVEDLLFERGIDVCHETVRLCPMAVTVVMAAVTLPVVVVDRRGRA